MDPVTTGLLLPYLLYAWFIWHFLKPIRREASTCKLSEDVLMGRRLLPAEYPLDIASVVDLTCEFFAPKPVRERFEYLCVPVRDAGTPSIETLKSALDRFDRIPRPVYVHCAEGHGRTATSLAAFMLKSGAAASELDR